MQPQPPILVRADDGVCRLTLNRPDKLNALNDDVRTELTRECTRLRDDPSVRVVVLDGAGRAFSAGADLPALSEAAAPARWSTRRHAAGGWQRLLDLLESLPQVTVAALHGHCVGGGALLAASCDLRVADTTLSVRIPELAVGIPLTWAGIPRLAREIGLPLARDLVMTGRVLDAQAALACGFITRLAAPGDLPSAVDATVAELLAMPAAPLAMTKSLSAALSREGVSLAGWADPDLLAWSLQDPEAVETGAAYVRRQVGARDEAT